MEEKNAIQCVCVYVYPEILMPVKMSTKISL